MVRAEVSGVVIDEKTSEPIEKANVTLTQKHPPKFCPNCAKPLEGENALQEYLLKSKERDGKDEGRGYDTYCANCRWSGNIEPDGDLNYTEEEK